MNIITEEQVTAALNKVLLEESSKIKRDEFNRIQFKIEELQNALAESVKEFRKLEESVPNGLQGLCTGRLNNVSNYLINAQKEISNLKDKLKIHKKRLYLQQVEERNKKSVSK